MFVKSLSVVSFYSSLLIFHILFAISSFWILVHFAKGCLVWWCSLFIRPTTMIGSTKLLSSIIFSMRMVSFFLLQTPSSIAPPGKVGFYLYYFEASMWVPPSTFFGSVIPACKIHTCQLKPNWISKITCFELLCHAPLVVSTVVLFQYFFCICSNGAWYYFQSRGHSFIEGLPDSIKNWNFGRTNLSGWTLHASVIETKLIFPRRLMTKTPLELVI